MKVTFEVVAGASAGNLHTYAPHAAFIAGRGERCRLRVGADPKCSRQHVYVEVSTTGCRVQDLGSERGTWVNEQRKATADLVNGDLLRIGETTLRVHYWIGGISPFEVTASATVEGDPADQVTEEAAPIRYLKQGLLSRTRGAQVWRAVDRSVQRPVALKTLSWSPDLLREQREEIRQRFLREGAIGKTLRHHRIVEFLEHGVQDGELFIAMELLELGDIGRYCEKHGPLPAADTITVGLQGLEALAHAHGTGTGGTIHRDFKPSNLLLAAAGPAWSVKVADFGLAKNLDELLHAGLSRADWWYGTLEFMPPEQLHQFSQVDHRADLFSLAATLYWLLTRNYVYAGTARDTREAAVKAGRVTPITEHGVFVPPRLCHVLHRALNADPAQRYADARELAAALAQVQGAL